MKNFKNWWYYHKWYVVCGLILLWILGDIIGSTLLQKKPDFQIAYVGENPLADDTAAALEEAFGQLGGDFNGDGKVFVQINQYTAGQEGAPEAALYGYSSQAKLIGDISACESYFFLTDDPEGLQQDLQILANPDGSCPDDDDYSAEGKVLRCADIPALAEMDAGGYTASPDGSEMNGGRKELLSGLYLGRRCFYESKRSDSKSQCDALWERIAGMTD